MRQSFHALRRVGLGVLLALAAGCGGDGGSSRDATPPRDAAPPRDGGPGVVCDGVVCPPAQACCSDQLNPPQVSLFCMDDEDLPVCGGVYYDCDGPEDCTDPQICCNGSQAECTDPGSCSGTAICHGDSDCAPFEVCCDTPRDVIRVCLLSCPS